MKKLLLSSVTDSKTQTIESGTIIFILIMYTYREIFQLSLSKWKVLYLESIHFYIRTSLENIFIGS